MHALHDLPRRPLSPGGSSGSGSSLAGSAGPRHAEAHSRDRLLGRPRAGPPTGDTPAWSASTLSLAREPGIGRRGSPPSFLESPLHRLQTTPRRTLPCVVGAAHLGSPLPRRERARGASAGPCHGARTFRPRGFPPPRRLSPSEGRERVAARFRSWGSRRFLRRGTRPHRGVDWPPMAFPDARFPFEEVPPPAAVAASPRPVALLPLRRALANEHASSTPGP